MPPISFDRDIRPFFVQYRGQMLWRFDLGCYEDVRANAKKIRERIDPGSENRMPPPPYPPFSEGLFLNFRKWIDEGFGR